MKNTYLLLLSCSVLLFSFGTKSGDGTKIWKILDMVTIKYRFNPLTENFDRTSTIPPILKTLDGKKITISGKMAISYNNDLVLTQRDAAWGCCSSPSLQEIVQIKTTQKLSCYNTKTYMFEGILKINSDQSFYFYTLEDAVCLNCKSQKTVLLKDN